MKRYTHFFVCFLFIQIMTTLAVNDLDARARSSSDSLNAMVESIVSPHVSPDTALTDMKKTIGMVVAVTGLNGSGIYGFGVTEVGNQRVPDGNTIFQIGSVSKVLTGLILAQEVIAKNGLKKTDLLAKHLELAKGCNGVKDITLEMLVTHYSGLESMPTNLPKKDPLGPAMGYCQQALKSYLCRLQQPVEVNKGYKYSNVGVGLLGLALQEYTQSSDLNEMLTKRVFSPLKISDMWGRISKIDAKLKARFAQGYAVQNGKRVAGHFSRMGVLASAGEVSATGNSMLILLKALAGQTSSSLDAAIVESLKPIKPTRGKEQIGYAIEIMAPPAGGGPIYKKPGSVLGGYTAFIAFRRNPAVGVAVMTNVSGYRNVFPISMSILKNLSTMAETNQLSIGLFRNDFTVVNC